MGLVDPMVSVCLNSALIMDYVDLQWFYSAF